MDEIQQEWSSAFTFLPLLYSIQGWGILILSRVAPLVCLYFPMINTPKLREISVQYVHTILEIHFQNCNSQNCVLTNMVFELPSSFFSTFQSLTSFWYFVLYEIVSYDLNWYYHMWIMPYLNIAIQLEYRSSSVLWILVKILCFLEHCQIKWWGPPKPLLKFIVLCIWEVDTFL